jgi:hypothetical protein
MGKIDPKIDALFLLLFCFCFFSSGNRTKLIILLHNNNKGIHRQQQHAVQQATQQPTGAMAAIVFGSAFMNEAYPTMVLSEVPRTIINSTEQDLVDGDGTEDGDNC